MASAGFFRGLIDRYAAASRALPFTVAFGTCLTKGCASDVTSQKLVEKRKWEEVNWRRVAAFGFFSGAYLGCGQHWVYNVWFTRMFGQGNSLKQVAQRVAMDAAVHVPMIYLPLYFMFQETALGDGPKQGIERYVKGEGWETLTTYWQMWPVFHAMNFRFTPPELRIAAIAGFSYIWLVVLSFISHQQLDKLPNSHKSSEPLEEAVPTLVLNKLQPASSGLLN